MRIETQDLKPVAISGGTVWTSATVANIDETIYFPDTTAGDGNNANDTDSGQNWQGWTLQDITSLEGGILREVNVFLRFPIGYTAVNAVKIEIDSTDYTGTLKTAGTYGSYAWYAYRVTPNISIDSDVTPILWVQSDTTEVRLDVARAEAVKTGHLMILRPASNHADNSGFSSYSEIGEPVTADGYHDKDGVDGQQSGKQLAETYLAVYTDAIPSTSGGDLVFLDAYNYTATEAIDYLYINDVEESSDIGVGEDVGNFYRKTYYDESDISSGLGNMGFAYAIPTLGAGENSDLMSCGYLVAGYQDTTGGVERLVPVGNGTNGLYWDRIDSGMDAKTNGAGEYSNGQGNITRYFKLKDVNASADKVVALRGLLYYAESSSGSNSTLLSTIRITESDESTSLTNTIDLSGLTLSGATWRTVGFDFTVTNTDAADWSDARIELVFTNASGSDQKYFLVAELEFLDEWLAAPPGEPEILEGAVADFVLGDVLGAEPLGDAVADFVVSDVAFVEYLDGGVADFVVGDMDTLGEPLLGAIADFVVGDVIGAEPLGDAVADFVVDFVHDNDLQPAIADFVVQDIAHVEELEGGVADFVVGDVIGAEPLGDAVADFIVSDVVADNFLEGAVADFVVGDVIASNQLGAAIADFVVGDLFEPHVLLGDPTLYQTIEMKVSMYNTVDLSVIRSEA